MNKSISTAARLMALVCGMALFAVIFLPLWKIEMTAPQYPEGLVLKIYPNRLGGDVEIVNGLNHYIGMRTLHEKDFPEFSVLPYIIGALGAFGLLSALVRKRWFFITWVVFYMLFAFIAMIDFYRWEYNYGHNLDPTAPIQVPGMSYQPPLIGFKQLLNFGVYSIPDSGGMIFIGVAILLLVGAGMEIRKLRREHKAVPLKVLAIILPVLMLASCSSGPKPIRYGTDGCDFCKMTIADKRFGGEVITAKGKIFKFDDIHCIKSFLDSGYLDPNEIKSIYLLDFSMSDQFVNATESYLLKSDMLRSPMGSNTAAFKHADSIKNLKAAWSATELTWNEVMK